MAGTLALAACGTPAYIETENIGQRTTDADQITQYFSGSFFVGPEGGGIYYGDDQSISSINKDTNYLTVGTWSVRALVGGPALCEEVQSHQLKEGNLRHSDVKRTCQIVYLQPDGTAKLDEMGGPIYTFPKPSKRYPDRAHFEKLRKQMGV